MCSASSFLIRNVQVINEGKVETMDVFLAHGKIQRLGKISDSEIFSDTTVINGSNKYLFPGIIDAHVHFREPGLTHKASIHSESMAAVAGGVTSFLEMPNTLPATTSERRLREKLHIASQDSFANYGFFIGVTSDNLTEVLRLPKGLACGIKLFLGSSTGNMLVSDQTVIEQLFAEAELPIVAHCEDEHIIQANIAAFKAKFPHLDAPASVHPLIRTEEACYKSSAFAVELATKHNTRLHIAHITTAKELLLLSAESLSEKKRITAEVTPTHLWFCDEDFPRLGNLIKSNPSVKGKADRQALREALAIGKIDLVATDHAPHTLQEKQKNYFDAPSGLPCIQHSLLTLLELHLGNEISLPRIAEVMSHNPAILFGIQNRGFIREGYAADLVLADPSACETVNQENLFYKCGWSPLSEQVFHHKIISTWVNGERIYHNGKIQGEFKGKPLTFKA